MNIIYILLKLFGLTKDRKKVLDAFVELNIEQDSRDKNTSRSLKFHVSSQQATKISLIIHGCSLVIWKKQETSSCY